MSDTERSVDGLISRLTVIDQQPLDQRAIAFAQLHEELRATLDDSRGESPAAGADPVLPGVRPGANGRR